MLKIFSITLFALACTITSPAFAQDVYDEAFPEAVENGNAIHFVASAAEGYVGGALLRDRAIQAKFAERSPMSGENKAKFLKRQKVRLAAGVALLSDGGARLLVALSGRNPSYSPAIAAGSNASSTTSNRRAQMSILSGRRMVIAGFVPKSCSGIASGVSAGTCSKARANGSPSASPCGA